MELKEAVSVIEKKVNASKEEMVQAVDTVKKHFEEKEKAFSQTVVDLNGELAKKGAVLEEIQGEIKELKAKEGRLKAKDEKGRTFIETLKDVLFENKDKIAKSEKSSLIEPIQFKAVANIATANLSGDNYVSYLDWRPGMEPLGQTHFRDLVGAPLRSDTDYVQFPRANKPIGEGSFAIVAEGATKPQVDRDYTMVPLNLATIAGYAIVSRQALRNIPFLQTWLPTSMTEQLLDTEDLIFGNQLVAAATGTATTPGVTAPIERIIHMISNQISNKYKPNGIAVSPAVWAALLVYRPGTDNGYGFPSVVTVGPDGTIRVLGMPVWPVNWLTGNRIIMGDWNRAKIVESEGLTLRQSDSHASIFTSNEVAFLLERTEGLAIFRPDAFTTVAF